MASLTSAHAIVLPFLFLFTLPIALFASLTTFFAFSVLLIRMLIIYIELALAIIPHYFLGGDITQSPDYELIKAIQRAEGPRRRKKRRASSSSNLSSSGGAITPVLGENMLGLSQSIGPTRDFEGVGGWRLDSNTSDDEGLWTNMNSRLELPADHGRRHHHRSLTSGSQPTDARVLTGRSYSPEANTSKARTSPVHGVGGGEYFPLLGSGGKAMVGRNNSTTTGLSVNSGSSGSSKGSSGLQMKQR